jgi:hypothetical protein
MKINAKRGFNRLFVVLTALWVVYCLFAYPIQQRQHAHEVYAREFHDCLQRNDALFKECFQYAELKSGENEWSLRAYYSRESWFLALVVVAVPLLAYGLCRGLFAIGRWVWRGFQSSESTAN